MPSIPPATATAAGRRPPLRRYFRSSMAATRCRCSLACSRVAAIWTADLLHPAGVRPYAPADPRRGRHWCCPQRGRCPRWPGLRPASHTDSAGQLMGQEDAHDLVSGGSGLGVELFEQLRAGLAGGGQLFAAGHVLVVLAGSQVHAVRTDGAVLEGDVDGGAGTRGSRHGFRTQERVLDLLPCLALMV